MSLNEETKFFSIDIKGLNINSTMPKDTPECDFGQSI
jgi:hypothetical protein